MFRKMRRFKQQISEAECINVLKTQPRGVLSVVGDDGYPYGIPLSHFYCEEDGHIYFHGAGEGHKIDALKKCDKVSFCVYDEGYRREGEWSLNIKSVVVFGRIRFVDGAEKKEKICRSIGYKFTSDAEYVENEVKNDAGRCLCLELVPEHMTGKLVNES